MRQARLKPDYQDTWHHCYNRTGGTRADRPFGDAEKEVTLLPCPLHHRVTTLPHKPLSDAQRSRLESFIGRHPDFRFTNELRHVLLHGWVEQESFGWASPAGMLE